MKGICFKKQLFHATIAGTKSQTRRIVKPPKVVANAMPESLWNEDNSIGCVFYSNGDDIRTAKPRYNIGELLYLKEPYVDDCLHGNIAYKYSEKDIEYMKNAGFEEEMEVPGFWKNKLFMPESAARFFIKITGVRIEILQDISDEDCIKEGVVIIGYGMTISGKRGAPIFAESMDAHIRDRSKSPQKVYANLIDRINGKGTWDSNPYVWVYDYELVDRKEVNR